MALSHALAPAIDLLFPPRCASCGAGISAVGLCGDCWGGLVIPAAPACDLCQRPFVGAVPDGLVCAPCLLEPPAHDGIAAATIYNAASRQLVLAFKHGGRIALAPLLARMMVARLTLTGLIADPDWLVVPVPLHRWRLWSRGFNQSALLAREIAQATGARLAVDGLLRRKATPALGGMGREARARALSGAIRLHPRRNWTWQGAKVVLVDDVLTSGATTTACVAVLKRAGAAKVVITCAARVMDETLPHV